LATSLIDAPGACGPITRDAKKSSIPEQISELARAAGKKSGHPAGTRAYEGMRTIIWMDCDRTDLPFELAARNLRVPPVRGIVS
jgi:hypothetical protein